MRIAVFGLGKLGSVLAALYASAGHEVVGVDLNPDAVAAVSAGRAPVAEPGLEDLMSSSHGRLVATLSPEQALKNASASFLIVPTPSDSDGAFSNEFVIAAIRSLGEAIRDQDLRHVVVIASTVMPGSTMGVLKEELELASGKVVGRDVGLVYSPEFIALGSIVRDMQHPDLVLIGESDPQSGELVADLAMSVVQSKPEIRRMAPIDAEVVKLAINTYVTTKISFANMLGELCDKLPDADIDVVTNAVGADSRIGRKYLKGGLGYGGPCFPRDNLALARLGELLGVDMSIATATDEVNERQVSRVLELVRKVSEPPAHVVVLGLSYKPETGVCERSQSIDICNELVGQGYAVTAVDPLGTKDARPMLDPKITSCISFDEVLRKPEVIILATPWNDFAQLSYDKLSDATVIDLWSHMSHLPNAIRLGRSAQLISFDEGQH